MHPRTKSTLEELRGVVWFRSVGVKDTDAAEVLSSWYEAIESSESPDWEELCLEAANQYRARLRERSPQQFEKWNHIVSEVKPSIQALVRDKTKLVIEENGLPTSFVDTVNWDILHLCMESEYAEVHPPGFFASQAHWYMKGHFPCGWQGQFPEGKLIIY